MSLFFVVVVVFFVVVDFLAVVFFAVVVFFSSAIISASYCKRLALFFAILTISSWGLAMIAFATGFLIA